MNTDDKHEVKPKKRGKLNLKFPAHYYTRHEQGITRRQVDEVASRQYQYMLDKLQSSVGVILKRKATQDDLMAAVGAAFAASAEQSEKNPQKFESMNGFFSYWLRSCWHEYRNASVKEAKLRNRHLDMDCKSWDDEGDEAPGLENLPAAEETQEEAGLQDFLHQEEFQTFVHERVYEYVDDAYLDGQFTLREITIFKVYCVNNYSIEHMARETKFSRTGIISALSKIKKQLATVDWRWEQFHPDLKDL